MLSIGVLANGQDSYYSKLARDDYYLQGGEPVGRWWGRGAKLLGFEGFEVTANALKQLMSGRSPGGEPLVQNAGARTRRPGFDLTFSAPKSVSALWAIAPEGVRTEIQSIHADAVKAALTYLESEFGHTRTGKRGVEVHRCGLVVGLFEHGTSRALDPQLHTHALLMNLGVTDSGLKRALVHTDFFNQKMTAGALYRAELAALLNARLGLDIAQDNQSFRRGGMGFLLANVPAALCDFWSKRRAEVEKVLGERGLETAASAAIATLDTRHIKTKISPRRELFEQWRKEAMERGFTFELILAFAKTIERSAPPPAFEAMLVKTLQELTASPEQQVEARTLAGKVIQSITAKDERAFGLSHFPESLLLRRLAENCVTTGLAVKSIREKLAKALCESPDIITIERSRDGERRLTTRSVIEQEERLLKTAHELSVARGRGVNENAISIALILHDRNHKDMLLGPERAAAVRYLTTKDEGAIRSLEGLAGTAKTSTLKLVKELYEGEGYRVIGTAVSGKAVRELVNVWAEKPTVSRIVDHVLRRVAHDAVQYARALRGKSTKSLGPDTEILAFTLVQFERRTDHTLLKEWLHHGKQILKVAAHQFSNRRIEAYSFKYKPLRLDEKTVIICDEASMVDTRQMAMLVEKVKGAGATLILVGDRHQVQAVGRGGAFAAIADHFGKIEIRDIVRQKDAVDRQMVQNAVAGQMKRVLEDAQQRGLLSVEKDKDRAREKLIADWAETERGKSKIESLILTGTREDANTLNRHCQEARIKQGELPTRVRVTVAGARFHVGDRVIFDKPSRSLGVENGMMGVVKAVNPLPLLKTVGVKLDDGRVVTVPLRDYKDLKLGYAVTTHKGQGSTVKRAYVLLGGSMQDKELSYVQVSRAEGVTRLYTNELDAGETLAKLARQLERSNQKTLASQRANRRDLAMERERAFAQEH